MSYSGSQARNHPIGYQISIASVRNLSKLLGSPFKIQLDTQDVL